MSHSPAGQWMAVNAVMQRGTSIALACRTFQISETCYRYSPILSDKNEEIADWLERLTENKRTWGFVSCFLYLRKVQGQANRAPMVREILAGLEPQTRASDLLQTGVEPADLEIVETEN